MLPPQLINLTLPVFAGINCLLVLYVYFLIPETKGVPLEEMDRLFGGVDHVQGGAEIMHHDDHEGKPHSDHNSVDPGHVDSTTVSADAKS